MLHASVACLAMEQFRNERMSAPSKRRQRRGEQTADQRNQEGETMIDIRGQFNAGATCCSKSEHQQEVHVSKVCRRTQCAHAPEYAVSIVSAPAQRRQGDHDGK